MKILNGCIEPDRNNISADFSMFPLVNYFDPKSMLAWLDWRIMSLDVGKRFTKRI